MACHAGLGELKRQIVVAHAPCFELFARVTPDQVLNSFIRRLEHLGTAEVAQD